MYRTIDKFATIKSIALNYFNIFILLIAVFLLANGFLHEYFVIQQHKGPYDRNLLRLLMDGHILITSGILYIIAFFLLRQNNTIGLYLCGFIAISVLAYCIMIYPFLKSFVTMALNLIVIIGVVGRLFIKF